MLYMTIFTYKPEKRNEVLRRRVDVGTALPPGMTLVSEYSALASGKVFRLVDVCDESAVVKAIAPWADLGQIEMIPVIETEEALKVLKNLPT